MGLTPKQERNGIPEMGPAGGNSPVAGPSADVSAVQGAAEVYGGSWQESGKAVFDGSPGTSGYSVADWDNNIAVTEQAGEA